MKNYFSLFSPTLVAINTAVFTLADIPQVSAIGCDTYYRVTGEIAGCTDISTEKAREVWLEKYNICLEQQLTEEISLYESQSRTYFSNWQYEGSEQDFTSGDTSWQDLEISSPSLSTETYQGNDDFCERR
ncbi:MAG: hypothetical protein AAF652_02030 [Cyanobacteria bacterium P01_C01_bin.72]